MVADSVPLDAHSAFFPVFFYPSLYAGWLARSRVALGEVWGVLFVGFVCGVFFELVGSEGLAARLCLRSLAVLGELAPMHERIMGSRAGEEWSEVVPDVGP